MYNAPHPTRVPAAAQRSHTVATIMRAPSDHPSHRSSSHQNATESTPFLMPTRSRALDELAKYVDARQGCSPAELREIFPKYNTELLLEELLRDARVFRDAEGKLFAMI